MNCKYSYQGELIINRHYLYCNINNKQCPFVRYCGKVDDIINSEGYINCPTLKEKERTIGVSKDKPNKVLFEKRGMLAVETNDEIGQVVMVKNVFDYIPEAVKLYKRNGEWFVKNEEKRD